MVAELPIEFAAVRDVCYFLGLGTVLSFCNNDVSEIGVMKYASLFLTQNLDSSTYESYSPSCCWSNCRHE